MKALFPDLPFDVRYEPARAGEILRNYASIDKARRMLGYNPPTQLDQGLKSTWEWFVSRAGAGAR